MNRSGAWRRPVPVLAVVGAGARDRVSALRLRTELRLVADPRDAEVVLLAGRVPPSLLSTLVIRWGATSPPAAAVWWSGGRPGDVCDVMPDALFVPEGGDVVAALVRAHRRRRSRPNAWPPRRDASVAPEGAVTLGPFHPALPPGLEVHLTIRDGLVDGAVLGANPFAVPDRVVQPLGGELDRREDDVFARALRRPRPVAEVEVARARHHLRWLADTLLTVDLRRAARCAADLARTVGPGDAGSVVALRRHLERDPKLHAATEGVAVVMAEWLRSAALGPVARASGVPEDTRTDDPAYWGLGFEPITQRAGDARSRWRQRLAETSQALTLAERALRTGRCTEPLAGLEGVRGHLTGSTTPSALLLDLLPTVLVGVPSQQVAAAVASLDLDLEEAATDWPVGVHRTEGLR